MLIIKIFCYIFARKYATLLGQVTLTALTIYLSCSQYEREVEVNWQERIECNMCFHSPRLFLPFQTSAFSRVDKIVNNRKMSNMK